MSDKKNKTSESSPALNILSTSATMTKESLRLSAPRSCAYPKKLRLRKRPEYLAAQRRGQRVHGAHIIVIAARSGGSNLRLGITASKKVGNAVQRNLVKRRLREIFRHESTKINQSADLVVIARHSAVEAPFRELREDFARSLKRALELMRKNKKGSKKTS